MNVSKMIRPAAVDPNDGAVIIISGAATLPTRRLAAADALMRATVPMQKSEAVTGGDENRFTGHPGRLLHRLASGCSALLRKKASYFP